MTDVMFTTQGPVPLGEEAGAVLRALAYAPDPRGLRFNDIATLTSLPTGHVGRHLRTLEAERLIGFDNARWRATLRGRRVAADLATGPHLHDDDEADAPADQQTLAA